MFVKSFLVGSLVLGLLFFAIGVWVALEGLRAAHWPAVKAEIVGADVVRLSSLHRHDVGREQIEWGYAPQVTYRWRVNGETFIGDRYRIGEGSSLPWHETRQEAEQAAASFPEGTELTIYVDPKNPSSAVMNRSASPWVLVPTVLAALCLAGSGLGFRHREHLEEAVRRGTAPVGSPRRVNP